MSMGYSPGLAGQGLNSGSTQANNNLSQGTNNIGQVYQDMGQNYQQFGQAYQQATQAANQLRSSTTTQQQQMNQYLQALQTALGGMSTAGQNTTNQQPMGQPEFSNGGINMPTTNYGPSTLGGSLSPDVYFQNPQDKIAFDQNINNNLPSKFGSPSMNPQDLYNQYASVVFGQPGTAYTPAFQG